jgi:hypothetical protein
MHQLKVEIENTFNIIRRQNLSIGDTISQMRKKLPPFDFYSGQLSSVTTQRYIRPYMASIIKYHQEVRSIESQCQEMLLKAKEASWHGNTERAIFIYQALIQEKLPSTQAYEQLTSLYRKRKDIESERWELKRAIEHFSRLKGQQIDHVMMLAANYNVTTKVQALINARKKIMYYANAYTLYEPLPVLQEWKKRLTLIEKGKDIL